MPIQFILTLISGIFIGGVGGYLGTLMLSKKMSVVAGPLAHLALPGVALALILLVAPAGETKGEEAVLPPPAAAPKIAQVQEQTPEPEKPAPLETTEAGKAPEKQTRNPYIYRQIGLYGPNHFLLIIFQMTNQNQER